MGLAELVLTGLAALCLNSTCVEDRSSFMHKRYQKLKEELKNETLIITTLKNGPLSGYQMINGVPTGTGVAFDIFHILQDEYGFKYEMKIPPDDVFESVKNGKGGVRNMLINQTVDVAVAFLPQQYDESVWYSRSLDTAQWVVLMKRPKESASGSGLLAPFTATVWTLIIISLLGVGPILWLVVLLRARMCKDDHDIVFSLPSCMWFVYGALLKQGSTLSPKTDSSRILFSTWWIFITILTAFYTANLTAFLTLSKFTLPIEAARDINNRYKWLTNKGNGILEQLETSKNLSIGDGKSLFEEIGLPQMKVDVDEQTILNKYILKHKYMYIREKTVLELIMYYDYKRKVNANIDEAERCTYVITTFPVCVFSRSFAFKPGFKYKELFDQTIQHLSESGITEFKQREFLPDTTICPLNLGSKERKLRNSDLMMTYMIVGGGLIISTIIFAVEYVIHFIKRHNYCQKHPASSNKLFLRNNQLSHNNNNNKHYDKPFVTPPPSYHTLFSKPLIPPGSECKKQVINGRQYWVINDKSGLTSLIPQRAPSALLFQYTQ